MTVAVSAPRITSRESPREILAAHFKSAGELPIRGGWGYAREDAVIIDRNDPVVPEGLPFNGVGIEYVFVGKRIYEELIIFRAEDDRYSGIRWNLLQQELKDIKSRQYDVLTFEVTALRDEDWEELKAEWEGPHGYGSPGFDERAHLQKRDARTIRYVTEYWFDITSFWGQNIAPGESGQLGEHTLLTEEQREDCTRISRNPEVPARNAELVDPEAGVFAVLGLAAVQLGGPYLWHSEDIDEPAVRGVIFRAYEPEAAERAVPDVASITIADATEDDTEPDVSTVEQADIAALDKYLQSEISTQFAAEGRELTQWMGSQLNTTENGNSLMTAYVVRQQDAHYQMIAMRVKVRNQRVVIIGSFNIAKKDELASPIFNTMRNIRLLR